MPRIPARMPDEDFEPITPETDELNFTDLGNAMRLVGMYGPDFRYVPQWGFLVWDARRFVRDDLGTIEAMAKDVPLHVFEVARVQTDRNRREQAAKWAIRSESGTRIREMISLVKHETAIIAPPELFDADPMVLNVANGTLDLRTGSLRNHSRRDLLTKLAPVHHDPSAKAPLWLEFLDRIFAGNGELIAYLQRMLGYCLTGLTVEHAMFLLIGIGANGKSTLLEVIRAMLGDYAAQTPADTLLARRAGAATNDVARLAGARFVSAVESDAGRALAEGLVKSLVGGDTITARYLFKEFFSYRPQFKLILATNNRPEVRGADNGIWRRLRLIPFEVSIPPEQQDRRLREKLMNELPGIMAWCVEGCLEWQRIGLADPACVLAATAQYREEQDPLAAFLADLCTLEPGATVRASELHRAYEEWARAAGEEPKTQTAFGRLLTARGFHRIKGGHDNAVRRVGVRLKADSSPVADSCGGFLHNSPEFPLSREPFNEKLSEPSAPSADLENLGFEYEAAKRRGAA